MQLANTKIGNSYILAGHRTDASPFTRDDDFNVTYNGDNGDIRIIIGENVKMSINVTGDETFIDGVNIFHVLRDLKNGLEDNDTGAISEQIERLDDCLNQILDARSRVGAKLNRLDTTENYWSDFKMNIKEILYNTEDVDITRAYTDLTAQETAYQASLAASSAILQSGSLIDFLR